MRFKKKVRVSMSSSSKPIIRRSLVLSSVRKRWRFGPCLGLLPPFLQTEVWVFSSDRELERESVKIGRAHV